MEKNQTFQFQGKDIQVKVIENSPWFLAADIAKALTVKDASKMVENANVKEMHIRTILNRTLGGEQKMLFVDESGMYKILMKSRKAVAEKFQDWVTEEVLPSIRKTGSYSVNRSTALPPEHDAELIRARTALIQTQHNFFKDLVDSSITFEDKGYLKLAAILRTKISNSALVETTDTKTNSIVPVEEKLLDVPESAVEVSIRLGYEVPHNYESSLGRAVKKKCEDLLVGKSSRYSTANDIKITINVYPPNNERVENAVTEYCTNKSFAKKAILN